MPPKVVDTLLVLVERAGEVVDKDTLIHSVWPDTSVVESSLTRNISLLRKTLAQGGSSEVVIQTVSKRGYRFLPTVEIVQQPGEPADLNARPEPAAGVPTHSTVAARRTRALGLGAGALALAAVAVALVVTGTSHTSRRSEVLTDADREYLLGRHLWHTDPNWTQVSRGGLPFNFQRA